MSSRKLNVYYNNVLIGILLEKHGKLYSFEYVKDAKYDLSLSMPRGGEPYSRHTVISFFVNLLPEGDILKLISKVHLVSENNTFSLLNVIGEDCAGAITLGNDLDVKDSILKPFTKDYLMKFLENSKKGLPYYEKGMRLSIAGVQNKTTIFIDEDNNYYIPSYSHPSTHIVKFDNSFQDNILINELFSTTLAKRLGMDVSDMELKDFESNIFLLIKRFDRTVENGDVKRIHMEDYAQITSTLSSNKYEVEGGPSFKNIIESINKHNKNPILDTISLAKILVFNFLIGNNDYHSKNLSVLYEPHYKLSPFYDLLSTSVYEELSTLMAMKINKVKDSKDVKRFDIIKELNSWEINGERILNEILNDFSNIVKIAKELLEEKPFKDYKVFLSKIVNIIESNFNLIS